GFVKMKMKERSEGKILLRRSLELDPSYDFGAFTLIDACIEDNELEEAKLRLENINPLANRGSILRRKIAIEVGQNFRKEALELFQEMMRLPSASDADIWNAYEAVAR